jgi:hypothetical protein
MDSRLASCVNMTMGRGQLSVIMHKCSSVSRLGESRIHDNGVRLVLMHRVVQFARIGHFRDDFIAQALERQSQAQRPFRGFVDQHDA